MRAKKSVVTIVKTVTERFSVRCPHCKAFISGTINRDTLRVLCMCCKKPIELIWEIEP